MSRLVLVVFAVSFAVVCQANASAFFERATVLEAAGKGGPYAIPKMVATANDVALIVAQDRKGGDWMLLLSSVPGPKRRGPLPTARLSRLFACFAGHLLRP